MFPIYNVLFFVFLCLKIWLKPDVILPFCAGLPTRLWKLRGEQYQGCLKQRHKLKFPRKTQLQKYDFQNRLKVKQRKADLSMAL